jgi:ketosteroid isomerase-like protein
MSAHDTPEGVERFVENWLTTYAGGDVQEIRAFYSVPMLAIFPDRWEWLFTEADVEALLSSVLIDVRGDADGRGEFEQLRRYRLTDSDVLVSGTWVLCGPEGTVTDRVTFTDLLHRTEEGWKIAVAIAHPPENVLA